MHSIIRTTGSNFAKNIFEYNTYNIYLVVQVAKPALCVDVYASEYYPLHKRLVPLRWMAPELVNPHEEIPGSPASDVWSFAIFLWELWQLADLPYRLLSDQEVLHGLQQGQVSLEAPEFASPALRSLLQRCTNIIPAQRPNFSDIISMLSVSGGDVV